MSGEGKNRKWGRYREFAQCDFDTIGTTSIASDIETALVIMDLMRTIGFERFQVRANNRKILNGLLQKYDLAEHASDVLRGIDKLDKIGIQAVMDEIGATTGVGHQQLQPIMQLAEMKGQPQDLIAPLERLCSGNELAESGLHELSQMAQHVGKINNVSSQFQIDVSIARGLDYYTGTIFETFLEDLPGIGSVCSGGRYDNLAELFTKQQLPGIGASLGLDRLLAAMEKLEMISASNTTAEVLIVQFSAQQLGYYFQLAANLRAAGINVEIYPEPKKLGNQFKYADRRGFKAVIVAGEDEIKSGKVQVKWMLDGSQQELAVDESASELIQCLSDRTQ